MRRIALQTSFLRSKVAVRVVVLFVLSAMTPVAVLTLIFYESLGQRHAQELDSRLQESAKSYGNVLFERLRRAGAVLSSLTKATADLDRSVTFELGMKESAFLGFAVVSASGEPLQVFGAAAALPTPQEMLQVESAAATAGRTRVRAIVGPNHRVWVALAQSLPRRAGASLVGLLNLEKLWGSADELDQRLSLCVLGSQGVRLFCSSSDLEPYLSGGSRREPLADGANGGMRVRAWELFLGSLFDARPWQIVSGAPSSELRAGLNDFRQIFLKVAVLTLLLVVMLSVHQIRHSFLPLEALMDGIRRIGNREFHKPVTVAAKDEFGTLAVAFNDMAERLQRQFRRLTALAQIDRWILTRKPREEIIGGVLRESIAGNGCDFAALALADRFDFEIRRT